MRTKAPHPVFLICFAASTLGLLVAVMVALGGSDCTSDQGSDGCTTKNQVKVDATITYALASMIIMIGGVGFQISGTKEGQPLPPPHAPFPAAGGPPWRGNVPPGPAPTHAPPGPPPAPAGPPPAPPQPPSGQR